MPEIIDSELTNLENSNRLHYQIEICREILGDVRTILGEDNAVYRSLLSRINGLLAEDRKNDEEIEEGQRLLDEEMGPRPWLHP